MIGIRRTWLGAVATAALASAGLISGVASAAPHATKGAAKAKAHTACTYNPVDLDSSRLYVSGQGEPDYNQVYGRYVIVHLRYDSCSRDVWAWLQFATHTPNTSQPYANATIHVGSGTASCTVDGSGQCTTAHLNDAGTTGYASAHDDVYYGRTKAY